MGRKNEIHRLHAVIQDKDTELNNLRKLISEREKEWRDEEIKIQAQFASWRSAVKTATSAMEISISRISILEHQVQRERDEIEILERKLSSPSSGKTAASSKEKFVEDSVIQILKKKLDIERTEKTEIKSQLRSCEFRLEEETKKLAAENECLKERLSEMDKNVAQIKQEILSELESRAGPSPIVGCPTCGSLHFMVEGMEAMLCRKNSELHSLSSQLIAMKDELDEMKRKMESTKDNEEALSKKESEVQFLQEQLERLQREKQDLLSRSSSIDNKQEDAESQKKGKFIEDAVKKFRLKISDIFQHTDPRTEGDPDILKREECDRLRTVIKRMEEKMESQEQQMRRMRYESTQLEKVLNDWNPFVKQ